ncbi:Ig-like domain-containing protein [Bacillaceae bacterium S4-13-58]
MKKILFLFFIFLVACTSEPTENTKPEPASEPHENEEEEIEENTKKVITGEASITLDKSTFAVTPWYLDNSHVVQVNGQITVGENPVQGVEVQMDQLRTTQTDEKGKFSFFVDKSTVANIPFHVVDTSEATVQNEQLSAEAEEKVMNLKTAVSVHYPIKIIDSKPSSEHKGYMDVNMKSELVDETHHYPSFGISKFIISGKITDANGNPVEDATVNFRRDGVEGFTMSEPSNTEGEYMLLYVPEDDEDHYMHVVLDDQVYTLPDHKVYQFPEDISVQINITLPKTGTVITDKPPYLVTKTMDKAQHKGIFVGVHTDKPYWITIPKSDGTFTATVPKEVYDQGLELYQSTYLGILKMDQLEIGDQINHLFVPSPSYKEPQHIIPSYE